jgi:hypothetical protein
MYVCQALRIHVTLAFIQAKSLCIHQLANHTSMRLRYHALRIHGTLAFIQAKSLCKSIN